MKNRGKLLKISLWLLVLCMGMSSVAFADDATPGTNARAVDLVWMLIAAFLVFFMQPGFAVVEAGFTRAKNAVNIVMKNLMDFSIGSLAFFMVGFGLMFGADKAGFFLSGVDPTSADGSWRIGFYMFQVVFAATAATIVSGAMAERTKFTAYLAYSVSTYLKNRGSTFLTEAEEIVSWPFTLLLRAAPIQHQTEGEKQYETYYRTDSAGKATGCER